MTHNRLFITIFSRITSPLIKIRISVCTQQETTTPAEMIPHMVSSLYEINLLL